MKHTQKMVMIPEDLLQSMETEHRLTAPAQLPTLTRLDQDMKQIMDSSLPEDQKVLLLDQLLQRYQGLTKQMKTEATVKPTVVMPKSEPSPAKESTPKPETKSAKVSQPLRGTPLSTKGSKIPIRTETPPSVSTEESAHTLLMDTPPDSRRKTGKLRYKARTPLVARLRSNRQWEPY